jgi:hypothetical protein
MRAIARKYLAPLLLLVFLVQDRPLDIVAGLASALSDGDAAAFMQPFDESMPEYDDLRRNVRALLAAGPASSSVELVEESDKGRLRVNWRLDVSGHRREREVTLQFATRGARLRIVALQPVDFFAP